MDNFTYSTETISGTEKHIYTCSSKRGSADIELFNKAPEGKSYTAKWHPGQEEERDLVWSKEVEEISELSSLSKIIRYNQTSFMSDIILDEQLTTAQEDAIDAAFNNHVAPV